MTIQQDSKKLLEFIYNKYTHAQDINARILYDEHYKFLTIITEQQPFPIRINNAIKYLQDIAAIDINYLNGFHNGIRNIKFNSITPKGIRMIENEPITPEEYAEKNKVSKNAKIVKK